VAQQITTTLVDDLDDTTTAQETISFALDGSAYKIDLSTEHATALRADLATWVDHARRSPTSTRDASTPNGTPARTTSDREHTAAVRGWARSNGYTVSYRGRIPAAVQEAFDSAH